MRHQPGAVLGEVGGDPAKYSHPGLDVAALRTADLPLGRPGQVGQIPVLDPDQGRLAEGEVQVEFDQARQSGCGVVDTGDHRLCALQQTGADSHQKFDQQRLLAREVPIDGRTADARRGTDVLQSDCEESAFGDQFFGRRQKL